VALLVGLLVTGTYGPGDRRRDVGRLFLGCALAADSSSSSCEMPIYEYRCEDCGRKQSVLTLRISQTPDPVCRRCGGRRMRRLFSRVALLTSEEDRLERLADPAAWGDFDEDDPASVARFARRLGEAVGEDLREEIEQAMEEELAGGGKGEDAGGAREEIA
jgi:putative FmdB family regulatory protein